MCVCLCVCVHKTADLTSNVVDNTQLETWNFRNTSFARISLVNFDRTEINEIPHSESCQLNIHRSTEITQLPDDFFPNLTSNPSLGSNRCMKFLRLLREAG